MKTTIVLALAAVALAMPQRNGNHGGGGGGPRGGNGGPRGGGSYGGPGPRGGYDGPRGGGGGWDGPRGGSWPIVVPVPDFYGGGSFLEGIGEGIGQQVGYCVTSPWNCYSRVENKNLIFDLTPEAKAEFSAAVAEEEAAPVAE